MAMQFDPVQAGDLITSDLFNRLLAEFNRLRDRVTVLEGATTVGEVGIQALVPSTGVVRPGDTLSVFGFGFGVSFGVCRVSIDEVLVPDLKVGSNDRQLVFDIPVSLEATIPAAGRTAVLTVSGFRGSARATLRLQPSSLIVRGAVEIGLLAVTPAPPAPISRDAAASFLFSARSTVAGATVLQLKAVFSGVLDPGPWAKQASFTDAAGTLLPSERLPLAANEGGKQFRLALAKVPATADTGFQVAVRGDSDDGLVTGLSDARPFKIGVAQEQQDPDIELTVADVLFGRRDDTGALIPTKGKTAQVSVRARLKQVGTYTVSVPTFEGGAGWTTPDTPQSLPVQTLPPEGFLERIVVFGIRAPDGAASAAVATFRVKRDGAANSRTLLLPLKPPPA